MEDLVISGKEHKLYKKFQKQLENCYSVTIRMPKILSQNSDMVFISIYGEKGSRDSVKKFVSEKMNVKSKATESKENVVVITLSDSEEEEESMFLNENIDNSIGAKSGKGTEKKNWHENSVIMIDTESSSKLEKSSAAVSNVLGVERSRNTEESSVVNKTNSNQASSQRKKLGKETEQSNSFEDSVVVIEAESSEMPKSSAMQCESSSSSSSSSSDKSSTGVESSSSRKRKHTFYNKKNKKVRLISSSSSADSLKSREVTSTTGEMAVTKGLNFCDKSKHRLEEADSSTEKPADFIPLCVSSKSRKQRNKTDTDLCNPSLKQNEVSNDDIVVIEKPMSAQRSLRPIVIDGSNVAVQHGKVSRCFSAKGIQLAVDYFKNRGHTQITVFVPLFRRHTTNPNHSFPTVAPEILENLANHQIVVFTPSRRVNGKCIQSYDDRFILQLASKNGGVIVSNDNFKDLINESDSFKKAIEERLLMYCFVGDEFMVPDDPLGRNGPKLDDFLCFPPDSTDAQGK